MSDIRRHLDATLDRLTRSLDAMLDALDALDSVEDVDVLTADGKIVIEFEDGTRFIINRQSGNDQIWLAEPERGWHYDWMDGEWICDTRGVELFASLAALISDRIGVPVTLAG